MGHQLDCLNCILTSLKNVVADPEIDDDDIIVFKHETVFINDMNLVQVQFKKFSMVLAWLSAIAIGRTLA